LKYGLNVLQPSKSELIAMEEMISEVDLMIVVAYGMLLPDNILNSPAHGCINVHTSLLPRWRGAAPIQRAIQAGDHETGITIMQMDNGLDTGPVLLQNKCPINPSDTSGKLHDRLANIGSKSLLKTLDAMVSGDLQAVAQDNSQACYAEKITKSEARIDWSQTVTKIDCAVRAFNPAPVCHTELAGLPLRIWQAEILDTKLTSSAGKILDCSKAGIDVGTGMGVLRILKLQPQGKRSMAVADFLNGNPAFSVDN
jgi:methionyl-tRNA formyltransferase